MSDAAPGSSVPVHNLGVVFFNWLPSLGCLPSGIVGLGTGLQDAGRASVWADSYRIFVDHPLFGVGPGGFAETSPTAREERDLRWAHNEFLQQGAETGLPGFLLLLGLLAWLFWKLWSVGSGRAAVAALAPKLPVVLSSGYSAHELPPGVRSLAKPWDVQRLEALLREVTTPAP